MKKAIKFLLWTIVGIVAFVLLLVLAMPIWFGPVVKSAANSIAPGIVKTDFNIGHLSLNPYTTRLELGEFNLGNPEGCSEKDAVRVGLLIFDAETASLMTDVIHIEEITLKDVFVSYVNTKEKVNNFDQIQYNVAGGKEKYDAAQAEKAKLAEQEAAQPPAKEESEKPGKKVIIDKITISGLSAKYGIIPVSIPSLTRTDIGKKSNGMTLVELRQTLVDALYKAAGAAGEQIKALGAFMGDATKQATEAATKATKQATEAATKVTGAATEAVGNVAGAATETVGNVAGAATGAVGDAAGAVGNTAAGAGKAATEAAGKAAEAVGDGAKKAADALKGLFK